ncbi:hypothetical protein [Paenibacillus sp. HB172176]|uniref:hypothetical protein n=1 Tax=Paenibacillus sp. HB172176 TaxID=2493690 RepID=UPI001439EAC4|nr:hypothetical protein [Paenibacillus sp. HB172176]
MKMKVGFGIFGNGTEWTKEMENYREALRREEKQLLPIDMLLSYVQQLSDREKQFIAQTLDYPFAKRDLRKWPDMLFNKMIRTSLQQANKDLAVKRRLLLAVLNQLPDFEDDEAFDLEIMINEQRERISRQGFWRYYWTVYFHPDKHVKFQLWVDCMDSLNKLYQSGDFEETNGRNQEAATGEQAVLALDKQEKKLQTLENLYHKETAQRQRLEQELAQKDKQLRVKQLELERLTDACKKSKRECLHAEQRELQQLDHIKEQERRWRADQTRWLDERQALLRSVHDWTAKYKQLEQEHETRLQEIAQQERSHKHAASQLKQQLGDQDELMSRLSRQLYADIGKDSQSLQQQSTGNVLSAGEAQTRLSRMRKALDLAQALEVYRAPSLEEPARTTELPQEIRIETPDSSKLESTESRYGTFYRRDHGGYIKLDNEEIFNITESLVYQHDLQHEAELLCTPSKDSGRMRHYEIEVLFQGDDSFSPISQFDGYIEQDEKQNWYCVDLNQSANRFPVHFKDIEIQKPSHGDPCSFNVMEGGSIARLTKLYRIPAGYSAAAQSPDKRQHPAELEPSRKRHSKPKSSSPDGRSKPAPYLEGCAITIIGGLRKWFEDVVLESGAALVHENGDHPDRISAELSRSQALFLLITSTSHRATWESIEIAKAQNIPHFIIQGSKSNLRMQLWNNREQIRQANPS